MKNSLTLWDACEDFICSLRAQFPPKKSDHLVAQFRSVLLRVVVLGLGHSRLNPHAKISQADSTAAIAFLKALPGREIVKVAEALHWGFEQLGTPQASRNNYAPRILDLIEWSQTQPWYPGREGGADDLRCPAMHTGRGAAADLKLTHRTGRYTSYGLKPPQLTPDLQVQIPAVLNFLTATHHPERPVEMKCIQLSSAQLYVRETLLMLGYCANHDIGMSTGSELQLSTLVPVVEEDRLEDLTQKQCRHLWQEQRRRLADWWARYDTFLRQECESISPRTRSNKLCALIAVAKFLYRRQVDWESGYSTIPVIQLLYSYLKVAMVEAAEWTDTKRTVVNFDHKWIERQPGQTTLTAIWEQVILPLQLETRSRDQWGQLREARAIAKSYKSFLIWHRLGSYPATRQSVLRTQKIAMRCPLERPTDVPPDGWYLPEIPLEWRERDKDQRPIDNCLYRTYAHKGQAYPEGVYILEVCGYKTVKKYGKQEYVIANQHFEDGTCLYDIYERYLCGQWLPGGDKQDLLYDWWVPQWRGRRGRWITKGRMEFEPDPQLQPLRTAAGKGWQAPWGYLLVNPLNGKLASETNFGKAFEVPAYRLTGKRVTPHILRSVWATWGFEIGLNQQQLLALAYAMNNSLETLQRVYERTTPEEKRRPIEEVINQLFGNSTTEDLSDVASPLLDQALTIFQQLSPQDQQILKAWLDSLADPAA
ncbi:MAG: hypothetical protein LH702_30485 [Phormidesmis sp. CAN_BIN44]|nr:hypothetical protein [Phormidesmis sp. CAN_BIN44]